MQFNRNVTIRTGMVAPLLFLCMFHKTRLAVGQPVRTIPEVFRTADWPGVEIDSVALWRGPDGSALLFVTAKLTNEIFVCDGITGERLSTIGKPGTQLGRLRRPNGVVVVDDLLFVVERDNRCIQIFQIPSMKPILYFGESLLLMPYGLTAFRSKGGYELYVTDNYPLRRPSRSSPPSLGARVKHFRVQESPAGLNVRFVRCFGEEGGKTGLQKVESILADPARNRLFVCDERPKDVKVFDLEGRYVETVAKGVIKHEPEGLVIMEDPNGPGGGWLVVADQGSARTVLCIFSRDGKDHIGDVTGDPLLANTDGITLSPGDLGPFKGGALYCVHNDVRVQAYAWADVLNALNALSR